MPSNFDGSTGKRKRLGDRSRTDKARDRLIIASEGEPVGRGARGDLSRELGAYFEPAVVQGALSDF